MLSKLEYVVRSLSKGTHKKFENYVINSIYSKIGNDELEPVTQQYVMGNSRYYIDLYFPQINVAIEVDESYHDNPKQKELDKNRSKNIYDELITTPYKNINVIRIAITNQTLETLNKKIQDEVDKIKQIIKNQSEPVKWLWGNEKLESIRKRGYLVIGDSFESMVDILSLFGKEVKGWMKCSYKNVWSPTLSVLSDGEFSNRNGWINNINEARDEICERHISDKKWTMTREAFKREIEEHYKRFVFLKYKDNLGILKRRFIGVFMASHIDDNRRVVTWRLKEKTLPLKNYYL